MTPKIKLIVGILLLLLCPGVAHAQTFTAAPPPFLTVLDDQGKFVAGACIWTFGAGTTTPITTYQTNTGTPNSNPIQADYAGRFTVYLLAGVNYKFVYENVCAPPAHGVALRTADNISGTPGASATVDITTAVAGTALSAGQCAYLSDGSGSLTAGQWFKCDSANTYSSTTPEVGITLAPIAASSTGSVRIMGSVGGLSSLSVGSEYFVGTGGAITSTAPTNRRHLGHADTATSLVLSADPPQISVVDTGVDDFRLTLTSGTPVTTADVTGASAVTVYCTPKRGTQIALYNSAGVAALFTSAEFSIAVPATTSTLYDVFAYNNAGVPALELLAWTNDTTRATALVLTTTGTYTKSGDLTRRYLGSMRTGTVSGQTEDSVAKRYLWNYYNRVPRVLRRVETTATWAYTTATYRQANAATANQVEAVIGVAEIPADLTVLASFQNAGTGGNVSVAIGEDSTTTPHASILISPMLLNGTTGSVSQSVGAFLRYFPAIGRHFWAWLEFSDAIGTTNWFGTNSNTARWQSGLIGMIEG